MIADARQLALPRGAAASRTEAVDALLRQAGAVGGAAEQTAPDMRAPDLLDAGRAVTRPAVAWDLIERPQFLAWEDAPAAEALDRLVLKRAVSAAQGRTPAGPFWRRCGFAGSEQSGSSPVTSASPFARACQAARTRDLELSILKRRGVNRQVPGAAPAPPAGPAWRKRTRNTINASTARSQRCCRLRSAARRTTMSDRRTMSNDLRGRHAAPPITVQGYMARPASATCPDPPFGPA